MNAPRAGRLSRRVTLEAPVDAPDDIGGAARGWSAVATVWAEIETPRGALRLAADRAEPVSLHRVTLRWRDGVCAQMRLRFGARLFAIVCVRDPDESRRRLVLECEEIAP